MARIVVPVEKYLPVFGDIKPKSGMVVHNGLLSFEGNVFGAVNLYRFLERVHSCADRAMSRYDTKAIRDAPDEKTFVCIGHIGKDLVPRLDAIALERYRDLIEAWTGETVEELREHAAVMAQNKRLGYW